MLRPTRRAEITKPVLTQEQALLLLKAADLETTETHTRRVGRVMKSDIKPEGRRLVLDLPGNTPYGNELEDFLKRSGIDSKAFEALFEHGQTINAYGGGEVEVSFPAKPIETIAGMTWEQANPHVAHLRGGKGNGQSWAAGQ